MNTMNWYKWSQNDRECNLRAEDLKFLEDLLMNTFRSKEKVYQDSFLQWSRCLPRYGDKLPLHNFPRLPGRAISSGMHRVLSDVSNGEVVLENPETIDNISKWCGSACIKFINMIIGEVEEGSTDSGKASWEDSVILFLRRAAYGEEVMFKLADRESLDRIYDILQSSRFSSLLVLGTWAVGVVENPAASGALQSFISGRVRKFYERKGIKSNTEQIRIVKGVMSNPNGSPEAIKPFLKGNIIHGDSAFLEIISDDRNSVFEELWKWKTVNVGSAQPNEEILGQISEYLNAIVSRWHASMFDSMRRQPYDYGKMMDIVMWINMQSKNPKTIRKNYDTFLKATKIKRPQIIELSPDEEKKLLPSTVTQGLINGDGILSGSFLCTFVLKESYLSEEDLQNLFEVIMVSNLEWENSVPDKSARDSIRARMGVSPITNPWFSTKNFRTGKFGEYFSEISEEKLNTAFRRGLKKFRFKDFVDKIKHDESSFPNSKKLLANTLNVFSLRLRIVKSLLYGKTSDELV